MRQPTADTYAHIHTTHINTQTFLILSFCTYQAYLSVHTDYGAFTLFLFYVSGSRPLNNNSKSLMSVITFFFMCEVAPHSLTAANLLITNFIRFS